LGKRSNFERKDKDFYPTPYKGVIALLPHLYPNTKYIEPCCGEGDLIQHLSKHDHICCHSSDLPIDATITKYEINNIDYFITNPPWDRKLLHPIIDNLRNQAPTWLLFDAGWMHTKQARSFLPFCKKIVSIGRLKWIPDSPYGSLDDCCWYLFDTEVTQTLFHGSI
jgi:hypothetical protein